MAFFFPVNIALFCESTSRQGEIRLRRGLFQRSYPHQTIARTLYSESRTKLLLHVNALCMANSFSLGFYIKSFRINTYGECPIISPVTLFRINTYGKRGGGAPVIVN